MVRIKMNLDEISDSFEVIEPGKYNAKVHDIEEKDSSSGNPMLEWTWKIIGGEYNGREIKSFTSLQEHALFGLKSHLSAFGMKGSVEFDTDKLIGKKAKLVIGKTVVKNRNTGDDMEVNRITSILPSTEKQAIPTKVKKAPTVDEEDEEGEDGIPF